MVQSNAKDVDDYIAEVSSDRGPYLERLRDLCRSILTGYDEVMAYGMPAYELDGIGEVAFASQKQYVSVYFLNQEVVDKNADALKNQDMGKGCLRFRRPADIDFALVETLLVDTRDAAEHRAC